MAIISLRNDEAPLFETFHSLKEFRIHTKLFSIAENINIQFQFINIKKLQYKNNKLKLGIDFPNNCKQLGVHPEVLIYKLLNVSHKDISSIRTLIISIFYCLSYTSLLFHLIIPGLVNTFYNDYVINICPRQLL